MSVYKILVNHELKEFVLFTGRSFVKYPPGWHSKNTEIITDAIPEGRFMDIQAEYEERRW